MESVGSELIVRLRELFQKMEASRIRLRPILADIAASIDKGFFIDADSDEVNALLKQILEAQEKFSSIEQTKRAANSGKLEQIDKSLADLEQNSMREEILQVLSRISTIVLDSNEPKMMESVKKVKLQAEHIKNKAAKIDMAHFSKLAERFVLLDEIISKDETLSTEKYLEAVQQFPDNPILLMALSQNKLHFPRPAAPEVVEVEPPPEKVEVKPEKKLPLTPNAHAVSAVNVKYKKIKPPPDLSLVIYDENSFEIERSANKKNFSVKSFNNKLHELLDSSDPSPIFRIFMESRIFFKTNPENLKSTGRFTKKLAVFVPTILEKLFAWGIADKVTWRDCQFYYLNNAGYELCSRVFRNIRTSQNPSESDPATLIRAIKYSSMKLAETKIRESLRINFDYNSSMPFARAERKFNGDDTQVLLMLSLNLLGKDWAESIAKFRMLIENEINKNYDIKAVFVFTFKLEDSAWVKLFYVYSGKTLFAKWCRFRF